MRILKKKVRHGSAAVQFSCCNHAFNSDHAVNIKSISFSTDRRDIGRTIEEQIKTQKFKATLWLSEDYPLQLKDQVLPIIDLMALNNAWFKKLRDFITLQVPIFIN